MRTVGILLFDDVEILDATGPFEVFSVASRLAARGANPQPFDVFTVGQREQHRSRHGLTLLVQHRYGTHPPIDVLIVPGGVVNAERRNSQTVDWIRHTAERCELIASVCTGAFLLAQAGLLDGRAATTHWEDLAELRSEFPAVRVVPQVRWTVDGRIWTSAGIAAGIDMSLQLVATLAGMPLAEKTAKQMEYRWQPG